MKHHFLIFMAAVLLFSCEKSRKEIIHGGSYKYWLEKDRTFPCKLYNYFDKEGKWTVYLSGANGPFEEYNGYDNLIRKKWDIIDDSIMIISATKAKIVEINEDMFILKYPTKLDTFISVDEDLIPPKYRCIHDLR